MADDIDDLLDEVEGKFCVKSTVKHTSIIESSLQSKPDDLCEFLIDFEEPIDASFLSNTKDVKASDNDQLHSRCSRLYLAGPMVPMGMATAATIRACDQLRCTACDVAVIFFDGFAWSPSTDYLFLRNNYPNADRLKARMEPHRRSRAYACQCQFRVASDAQDLQSDISLKWVCGKH